MSERAWAAFRLPHGYDDDLMAATLDLLAPHRIGEVEVVAVGEDDTLFRCEVPNG